MSALRGQYRASESAASWRKRDRLGLGFAWFIGLMFCVICVTIVAYLAVQGVHYLHPSLLYTNATISTTGQEGGGLLSATIGTLVAATIAMMIAGTFGVGIAVWLSEYARPRWLARIVESTVEMFAGAPAIVLALFGVAVFSNQIFGFLSTVENGHAYGKSFFVCSVILSLLGLPLVVASVREGLQAIPNHVREASYAVGKSKITTIRRVLLPAVRPNIITGTMIGAGHVIGDTAIIVFLLGDTYTLQPTGGIPILKYLLGTGDTLTSYTYDNAPTGSLNQPHKAYAAAFLLLIMVLIINLIVDVFGRKSRELKWS
jgi:phosphate transport system permease protein